MRVNERGGMGGFLQSGQQKPHLRTAAPGVQGCELTPARKLQVLGKAAHSAALCGIFPFAQAGYDGQ